MNQGELRKGEECILEPSECRVCAEPLCKVLPRSIAETNDLLAHCFIGLAVHMTESALARNCPGEQQESSRPNMTIERLKKRRLILCRNMFSNLETENAIDRRAHKRRIGQIGHGTRLEGRGQRIPVEPMGVDSRGAKGLDILSKSASEVVHRPNSVLSEDSRECGGQRRIKRMFMLKVDIDPEPRVRNRHFFTPHIIMKFVSNRAWSQEPEVVVDRVYRPDLPTFSVVMPIHNQGGILYDVLLKVFIHTHGLYDLFLILDGCTDESRTELLRAIEHAPAELCQLTVVSLAEGIFETSCDNLGFVNARAPYIVELQADMQIQTSNYNVLLALPLEVFPDLIAVSGRCCHSFSPPYTGTGKLGAKAEEAHCLPFSMYNQIFLSHTVNRGPLVLRREMVEALGYLNEQQFVLEDDEHDLFYRAWTQNQWRTAFFPIEVYSPLAWGSTRKARPAHVQAYLDSRRKPRPAYDLTRLPKPETRWLSNAEQLAGTQRLLQPMSL
jgi:hypothetical protein